MSVAIKRDKYSLDMTTGNLFKKILIYSIPIMLTGFLQLLYNAADVVVVGKFAGTNALAAVGSTGSLIGLVANLFMGLSVGASVAFARSIGMNDHKRANKVVHTAVLLSLISGLVLTIFGVIFAKQFLIWMNSPKNVINLATDYVRIYFAGITFNLLYNYAASVVRANGDTKRPLVILFLSGILNVGLNLIFVIFFKMSAAGVALATIISQAMSAFLIMMLLIKERGPLSFSFKKLKIDKDVLKEMILIGLPSGIQSSLFSVSNVIIQKSINGFGETAMAGNAAAGNIEGFVYTAMNSIYQATLNFTSQNYGAKKFKNTRKILWYSLLLVFIVGEGLGVSVFLLGRFFVGIYSSDASVIDIGMIKLGYCCALYGLFGLSEIVVGALRGLGQSFLPMVVSLLGICVFRIVWIETAFKQNKTLVNIYISYPISWILTFVFQFIIYWFFSSKIKEKMLIDAKV